MQRLTKPQISVLSFGLADTFNSPEFVWMIMPEYTNQREFAHTIGMHLHAGLGESRCHAAKGCFSVD